MTEWIKSLLQYVGLVIICGAVVAYTEFAGHSRDAGLFGCIIGSGFYLITMIKRGK